MLKEKTSVGPGLLSVCRQLAREAIGGLAHEVFAGFLSKYCT